MELITFFQYGEIISYSFFYDSSDWTFFGVSLGVAVIGFLIMYGFRAYSMYVICVREGYKNKWMAFVPFLNTYYIGDVARKNKLFNANAKAFSIPTAALEFLMFVGYILLYVVEGILVAKGYIIDAGEAGYEVVAYAQDWMAWIYNYMGIILSWVSLVYFVMFMFTLMPFFMTYSARRYAIMSLFGAFFPISGALMFAVRNNRGMGYKEFMQGEQERMYRQYQQNQQSGNPYNYNPYSGRPTPPPGYGENNGQTGQQSNSNPDPFEDFDSGDPGSASTSGSYGSMDPFSDDFEGERKENYDDVGVSEPGESEEIGTDKTEVKTEKKAEKTSKPSEKTQPKETDTSPFDDF
ncbi:MAG: hypothetical protein LUD29_00895 [Clostridia bacterium]|nr:hypothetical protein [Clostridia bacterium]